MVLPSPVSAGKNFGVSRVTSVFSPWTSACPHVALGMLPRMKPTMDQPDAPSGGQPAGSTGHPDNACKHSLLSVIEQQIIPRLLRANTLIRPPLDADNGALPMPDAADIEDFALSWLHAEASISHALLLEFRDQGFTTEQLFLQVIAPAARYLGVQWEQDQLDFSQVTLGLLRLHQLSHELGYAFREGPQEAGVRRRIMLASAPGSQHLLGLTIVSEFFRKERWQVVVEISTTAHELAQAISNEWFEVLGLSVGVVEQLQELPALIQTLRQHSRNPDMRVLLGGPAFITQAVEARSLGADGISLDAAEAVELAVKLLGAGGGSR